MSQTPSHINHRAPRHGHYRNVPTGTSPVLHEACARAVQKHASGGATVLDLGAGYGALSLRLQDLGYRVTGADMDPSEWQAPTVPVISLDLNAPLPDSLGRFDCIVSIEVIEHLENPHKFVRDCRRLLNPGGLLIFSMPNVLDLDSRRLFLTRGQFHMFRGRQSMLDGHTAILPAWMAEELAQREGFRVMDRIFCGKTVRPWPLGWISPILNLTLLPLGLGIPVAAAFSPYVMFIIRSGEPSGNPAGVP